jgi:signal peptidase I
MDVDPNLTPQAPQPLPETLAPLGMDFRAWLRDIFLSLLIATAVVVFLYQPVKVEGTSMLPQLVDEQRIFVNKFVYRFDKIERGDVVVFKLPEDPTRSYIKRVVGLPGETVEVLRGRVFVDGIPFDEDHVPPSYRDYTSHPSLTVPPDEYYVLGDHRNTSKDSRSWGTVARPQITGKAVFAYWPIERFGTVR